MFVVLFVARPRGELWDEYLDTAKLLRPELETIDGFLENERYRHHKNPQQLLSLSTWRNEKALIRWRTQAVHHAGQERGRFELFADYRLRVGEITADTGLPAGETLRDDRRDLTETGDATSVSIVEGEADGVFGGLAPDLERCPGLVGADAWNSIYTPGQALWLFWWRDDAARQAAEQSASERIAAGGLTIRRQRVARIIRDYGRHDRAEAPQYYAPVERPAD